MQGWGGLVGANEIIVKDRPCGKTCLDRRLAPFILPWDGRGQGEPPEPCRVPGMPGPETRTPPCGGVRYNWRRGRDSNPRYAINVRLISSQVHSTTLPPLQKWAGNDKGPGAPGQGVLTPARHQGARRRYTVRPCENERRSH